MKDLLVDEPVNALSCLPELDEPSVRGIPGPYRFFFYSFDCGEPKHVHVRRERLVCSSGSNRSRSRAVTASHRARSTSSGRMLMSNPGRVLEAWDEHCG
jgi:hypothetical protein